MPSKIESDSDFRAALDELPAEKQRQLGKQFVSHVLALTDNPAVKQSMAFIGTDEPLSENELTNAYKLAKAAAIESYTLCGNEGDWRKQAGHFVAAAAAACLIPQPGRSGDLAWNTAMNARMARTCSKIAEGDENDNAEAMEQYRILESFQ